MSKRVPSIVINDILYCTDQYCLNWKDRAYLGAVIIIHWLRNEFLPLAIVWASQIGIKRWRSIIIE